MRFYVLDTINVQLPFEKRLDFLCQHIPDTHRVLKIVPMWKCHNNPDLLTSLASVEDQGRVGLLLRKPTSHYYQPEVILKAKVGVQDAFDGDVMITMITMMMMEGMIHSLSVFLCWSRIIMKKMYWWLKTRKMKDLQWPIVNRMCTSEVI